MKKVFAVILCICIMITLVACGNSNKNTHNMGYETQEKNIDCSLSANDTSEIVFLNSESVSTLKNTVDNITVDFPYVHLYQTDECYNRLQTSVSVDKHQYSALNSSGVLEAENLMAIVKNNNAAYLAENDTLIEEPKDDFLLQICTLIVDTVDDLKKQQPDIDYERVYCNLGNLKIVYKKAMVDNAQVTADMVLNISETMFQIVDIMTNENGCRNVIIHEIMHMVQLGCSCEQIENCTMRCGISYLWDDFEFNTSDLRWFYESSAERSMCNLTGDELFTYEYMVNYLCSLNLCTILDEDNPANYAETISFYSDADKLYKMFNCGSQDDIYEILNMMIAINIIQYQPEELLTAYAKEKGVDVSEQTVLDDLNRTLKPAIVSVFTKHFYKNLAQTLNNKKSITINDICYLIALLEATLDNHIKYTNATYNDYNDKFIVLYKSIRGEFFEKIKNDCGVDISAYYETYSIFENEETKVVNASLKWCPTDKADFFLERTSYLEFNIKSKI